MPVGDEIMQRLAETAKCDSNKKVQQEFFRIKKQSAENHKWCKQQRMNVMIRPDSQKILIQFEARFIRWDNEQGQYRQDIQHKQ